MLTTLLAILAIAIIGTLATYAASLHWRLYKRRRQHDEVVAAQNARLLESIDAIARAMRQEQCPLSEGSIRIAVLLDHMVMQAESDFPGQFPAIHEMYGKIKHMPTHEARKQYPREQIERMDEEREALEQSMSDAIQQDVEKLLTWMQDQKVHQTVTRR